MSNGFVYHDVKRTWTVWGFLTNERDFRMQWSRALSLMCEVALR